MKNAAYYTNVQVIGDNICLRAIRNGKKIRQKIEYRPTLYLSSKNPSPFKTLHGETVEAIQPGSIRETRDFIRTYKDVSGFTIYGNQSFEYGFIADTFKEDIDWDISALNIGIIDIEVGSENGFPEPSLANEEITAITFKTKGIYQVFGCGDYTATSPDVVYNKCRNEIELIQKFLDLWTLDYPDIISGWNIKFFDFPYIINRIKKVLGAKEANRLSPWGKLGERTVAFMGREQMAYELSGVAMLDYIELFRKFSPNGASQESYKLDHIAHVEIGEKKLSYEEYGNLHKLYRMNYPKFIDYNIQDCRLIEKMDDKLKLFELALTLAYSARTNYDDVFSQVRMWDAITFNHLLRQNIVIPPKRHVSKDEKYEGAYVKDPILGMHSWIASYDLNSLYPHLIMQYNLSPDMLVEPFQYTPEMHEFMTQKITVDGFLNQEIDTLPLQIAGVTVTPNKQFFRVDKQGFLAEIMQTMYDNRTVFKKKATEAKKELEKATDPEARKEIEKRIARFNNMQLAMKVSLNSAYGTIGNQWFRFFDVRIAEAVTLAGQLSIRWIEKDLNGYMNKISGTKDHDYVIASDTDSIYLSFANLIDAHMSESVPDEKKINFMDAITEERIQPFIDKSYDRLKNYMNGFEQKMQMKREALASKAIWTAKKRYILFVHDNEGVRYAKPKMKIHGLEAIKSSTPSACRSKIKEAMEMIMKGDEDKVVAFIEKFRLEFSSLPAEEIAFPRSVNGLSEYSDTAMIWRKGSPIHVKGSLVFNHQLKQHKLDKDYAPIQEGEKIKFMYMKEPNTFRSPVLAFAQVLPKELDAERYIDYNTMFEKAFLDPLKIVLDSIGWKTEQASTLEAFFS